MVQILDCRDGHPLCRLRRHARVSLTRAAAVANTGQGGCHDRHDRIDRGGGKLRAARRHRVVSASDHAAVKAAPRRSTKQMSGAGQLGDNGAVPL